MIDPYPAVENKEGEKLVNVKLYVRYMVSLRCKKLVKDELDKLEIKHTISSHGAIEFFGEVTQTELDTLKVKLQRLGMNLLDVQNSKLIDRIVLTIIDVIHYFDELPTVNFGEIVNDKLGMINQPVLKIFSEVMGMSVIQFIVIQKIERIKELLIYEDLSISQITNKLNYKSEPLLIAQFKKHTGLTPAHFMKLKEERSKIISKSFKKSGGKGSPSLN
ncbi:MAG: AraC family transcriptional regulator [Balneolaceae bacterium]|nr:MAG: AraC family transcriptional regulator [Balneolaceae bacterium]